MRFHIQGTSTSRQKWPVKAAGVGKSLFLNIRKAGRAVMFRYSMQSSFSKWKKAKFWPTVESALSSLIRSYQGPKRSPWYRATLCKTLGFFQITLQGMGKLSRPVFFKRAIKTSQVLGAPPYCSFTFPFLKKILKRVNFKVLLEEDVGGNFLEVVCFRYCLMVRHVNLSNLEGQL